MKYDSKALGQSRGEIYKIDLSLVDKNDVRWIASDFIQSNSTVLDVGCACGDFGDLLSKTKVCCEVFGMEYETDSIEIAKNTKAYNAIHQIDLNKFERNKYDMFLSYFDSIVFLDVLEHISSAEEVLYHFSKFLKSDGAFIISIPNISFCDIKIGLLRDNFDYSETGILDKTHIKFYTYKSIAKLMTKLELEIVECKPKVGYFSEELNNMNVPRYIRRYIKKNPHSFVYQYVLKAKPSNKSKEKLEKINMHKMNLNWSLISRELSNIKKNRLIQKLFPSGSIRHSLAKRFKNTYT